MVEEAGEGYVAVSRPPPYSSTGQKAREVVRHHWVSQLQRCAFWFHMEDALM